MSMADQRLELAQGGSKSMGATIGGIQEGELSGGANTFGGGAYGSSPFPGLSPFEGGVGSSGRGQDASDHEQERVLQDRVASAQSEVALDSDQWMQTGAATAHMLGYPSLDAAELQRYRYFVVLLAYANQPAAPGSKPKLLWETRFSISEHRNRFDEQLAAMVQNAAPFFGQDSQGLVHRDVPAGHVEIGEVRTVDDVTAATGAALSPDGSRVAYLRSERFHRRLVIVDLENPGRVVYGDVPNLGAIPTDFAWSDAGHVGVTLSSNESFTFDASGRRTDKWSPPAAGSGAGAAVGKVLPVAAAKFPPRAVVVCGSDRAGNRFLLEVSGGEGPARYYVFDRVNDVLVDVGRTARSP
jgi:hypothetical protein